MSCKITYNSKGMPVGVKNLYNNEESKLFLDLLSIPFISNAQDALDVYLEATSKEFLDNNVELNNGEPIVSYASGTGEYKQLFNNFEDAKNYSNGDVLVGFAVKDKIETIGDARYIKEESFLTLYSYAPSITSSANSSYTNKLFTNEVSGNKFSANVDLSKLAYNYNIDDSVIVGDRQLTNEDIILMQMKANPSLIADALLQNKLAESVCD